MTIRPKTALIGLAVLSVLVGGCASTGRPARPVADSVTTTPAAGPTTESTPAEPTGEPAATTAAAKPKPTSKPAPAPTTHRASPRPSPKPSPKPTTKPTTKPATKPPSGQQGVHPGAFCKPDGAIGYTSKGTRMRCTRKAGEDRARWRAA